jgi:hypothetical protein
MTRPYNPYVNPGNPPYIGPNPTWPNSLGPCPFLPYPLQPPDHTLNSCVLTYSWFVSALNLAHTRNVNTPTAGVPIGMPMMGTGPLPYGVGNYLVPLTTLVYACQDFLTGGDQPDLRLSFRRLRRQSRGGDRRSTS